MSRTDRLRAALAAKPTLPGAAPPPAPEPAPPPEPEKSAKEKRAEKRAASPVLTHSCGHTRPILDLEHIKCPACRDKDARERAARKRAMREAKKAAQPAPADEGRLPDGSDFAVKYDANLKVWRGSLTVPMLGNPLTFTATASGVFRLLKSLDALYRQSLQPQGG